MEPVELNVVPQNGYGRLVLTFEDRTLLPVYDAVITGGVLRISFESPIDVNVDDVPLDLGDYITIARRDPDGSAIRFALKDQFQINTLEAGEMLFVDILPTNWQGLPPGLPDDVVRSLAKRAEAAMRKVRALEQARLKAKEGPQVTLHIGEHPTFTRLVFDWSIRFDTAFVREDDIIKVTFNHPAQLDISDLRAHLPTGVVDATSFLDKGKLKFLMRIDPSVDIRAFREEQTYVIDVTPESMEPLDAANERINSELNVTRGATREQAIVAPGIRNTERAAAPTPARSTTPAPSQPASLAVDETAMAMVAFDATPAAPGNASSDATPVAVAEELPVVTPAKPELVNGVDQPGPIPASQTSDADTVTAPIALPVAKPRLANEEASSAMPLTELASQQTTEVTPAARMNLDAPGEAAPDLPLQDQATQTAEDPAIAEPAEAEPVMVEPVLAAQVPVIPDNSLPPPVILSERPANSDVWRANDGASIPGSPEQAPSDFAEEARNFVSAEARRIGNTVRVVFPFVDPVSSAVFRRNDSIWLVFDTDATIDVRGMISALAETADRIDVNEHNGFQVLRLDLNDPVLATVGLDGNAWSLVIGDMILEPSIPLKMDRNVQGDGSSVLRVLYKEPQHIRQVTDPFVGDKISIVTGFGPPRGLLKPQRFVDLETLSSAQGINALR